MPEPAARSRRAFVLAAAGHVHADAVAFVEHQGGAPFNGEILKITVETAAPMMAKH